MTLSLPVALAVLLLLLSPGALSQDVFPAAIEARAAANSWDFVIDARLDRSNANYDAVELKNGGVLPVTFTITVNPSGGILRFNGQQIPTRHEIVVDQSSNDYRVMLRWDKVGFGWGYSWREGAAGASLTSAFGIPWFGSFSLSQAFFGSFSHNNEQNFHAIDVPMPLGTRVNAARRGIVTHVVRDQPDGTNQANLVRLLHADGSLSSYVHFRQYGVNVNRGQMVEEGQQVGQAGTTGFSTGPHLHMTVSLPNGVDSPYKTVPWQFRPNITPQQGATYTGSSTTTTRSPTSRAPTSRAPTSRAPTSRAPTSRAPTTRAPTSRAPTSRAPTSRAPTSRAPTSRAPTLPPGNPTSAPTTRVPTTRVPTSRAPTSRAPTTRAPTSRAPTSRAPTSRAPTTRAPTSRAPTSRAPTSRAPTTRSPTPPPGSPTLVPTTATPTLQPTTRAPTTATPTLQPTTHAPTTPSPTPPPGSPTLAPTTPAPTMAPILPGCPDLPMQPVEDENDVVVEIRWELDFAAMTSAACSSLSSNFQAFFDSDGLTRQVIMFSVVEGSVITRFHVRDGLQRWGAIEQSLMVRSPNDPIVQALASLPRILDYHRVTPGGSISPAIIALIAIGALLAVVSVIILIVLLKRRRDNKSYDSRPRYEPLIGDMEVSQPRPKVQEPYRPPVHPQPQYQYRPPAAAPPTTPQPRVYPVTAPPAAPMPAQPVSPRFFPVTAPPAAPMPAQPVSPRVIPAQYKSPRPAPKALKSPRSPRPMPKSPRALPKSPRPMPKSPRVLPKSPRSPRPMPKLPPPPKPPASTVATVLYDYQARNDRELSIVKGDQLIVTEKAGEWTAVRRLADGAVGYVPHNYIKE